MSEIINWNIKTSKEKLLNKFLAYYLGFAETVEKMMKQSKATAGQFNLTLEICRNIMIPVPDYETQEKIVYEIETKMSVCEEIERTVDEFNVILSGSLKKSYLCLPEVFCCCCDYIPF